MKIKFVDLKKNLHNIEGILKDKINNFLFNDCYYVNGPQVKQFEENFASYIGTKYCLGVNSGTDALKLSIKMLGLKENDEILVQGNTFIGSVSGASELGCKLKIIDINPKTYMIDIEKIEQNITTNTKGIIIVHLFGLCADMDKIMDIAKKNNLYVIEDVAQAHGAYYKDKRLGSIGDIGCFSFYPSKNLGAMGDGGAITTNNEKLYNNILTWRNWGAYKKYHHKYTGGNSRLDTLQAIILDEKLKHLDDNNKLRRNNANIYIENLKDISEIELPKCEEFCKPVWHLFVIKLKNKEIRDNLQKYLNFNEIETGIHYPIPIHKLEAYPELYIQESNLSNVSLVADRILSLPMYPELTKKEIVYVCDTIKTSTLI
jgi:dTDP-4-amino-4,6-dideoxygalactose transaminase